MERVRQIPLDPQASPNGWPGEPGGTDGPRPRSDFMDRLPRSLLLSRRQMIQALGGGLGALGLASVLSGKPQASAAESGSARLPHFAPRAKRVIHLFMNGGPFGP